MTRMPFKSAEGTEASTKSGPVKHIYSPDGVKWQDLMEVPGIQADHTPVVGVLGGATLYCIFKGQGTDNQLYYVTSTDGDNWSAKKVLHGEALVADEPALTMFTGGDKKLHCIYRAAAPKTNQLYDIRIKQDGSVESPNPVGANSLVGPSAVEFQNRLYCFHVGA
jgi:hypothetical protein